MTLEELAALPGDFIGTKELSAVCNINRGDVLQKAYAEDPLQRWPFPYTFNGNRLMVPKAAFLRWARGADTGADAAQVPALLAAILSALDAIRERETEKEAAI